MIQGECDIFAIPEMFSKVNRSIKDEKTRTAMDKWATVKHEQGENVVKTIGKFSNYDEAMAFVRTSIKPYMS